MHLSQIMTKGRPSAHVLLFVLLAMGLRLFYLPLHLAQEEHIGIGGLAALHEPERYGHDDHEHHDEHVPHHVFDHVSELLTQRHQSQYRSVVLSATPSEETLTFEAPRRLSLAIAPESEPPKSPPPSQLRQRGPPAAV